MITREDYLNGEECLPEHEVFLDQLLYKVNLLESHYGHTLVSSSGSRTWTHHMRVYREKGFKIPLELTTRELFLKYLEAHPESNLKKIPINSKHLTCQADDIVPEKKELLNDFKKFIFQNPKLMEEIGLWFEDFGYTLTWVHAQTTPPKSKKRFFIP
jgi:hypothetical protein